MRESANHVSALSAPRYTLPIGGAGARLEAEPPVVFLRTLLTCASPWQRPSTLPWPLLPVPTLNPVRSSGGRRRQALQERSGSQAYRISSELRDPGTICFGFPSQRSELPLVGTPRPKFSNKSQVSPSFRPTSSNFYFPNNLASSIPPPTFTYLIPS